MHRVFGSIRAQLIATTIVIFGLVLTGSTVVTDLAYRHAVMGSIDDYLGKQAEGLSHIAAHRFGHPRRDEGPPPGSRPGDHFHGPPATHDPEWAAPAFLPVGETPTSGASIASLAYDLPGYRQAALGNAVIRTVFADGEQRRVISQPAVEDGRVRAVVQIPYGLGTTLAGLNQSEGLLFRVIVPLGFLVAGLTSYFVVKRLLKPLRQITMEADRIGAEGFGNRLEPLGADEFAALAGTLNGMLDRLERHYQSEKKTSEHLAEAIERQRRFTSDASHELKTPLTVFRAHLGVLRRSSRPAREETESLQDMEDAANRMNSLLQDLLLLARTDAGVLKPRCECSLNEVVERAVASVHGASDRTIITSDKEYSVTASPDELNHVFTNLIDNAIKYSGSRDPISIRLDADDLGMNVVVEDFGRGIEARHLPHLFERFYRADESRTSETGGSGLGLAICEQLVIANGGSIRVESEVGRGTRFVVRLVRD